MKSYSLLLAGMLIAPLTANAGMSAMDNAELSNVSGQAYVVQFGPLQKTFKDLTERNLALGPLHFSDDARKFVADHPEAAGRIRQGVVLSTNVTSAVTKAVNTTLVAAIPFVGLVAGPIVALTPRIKIGYTAP